MEIPIRNPQIDDYSEIGAILQQVQNLHVKMRPDIYRPLAAVMPEDEIAQIIRDGTGIVAETEGKVVGLAFFTYRDIDAPTHVARRVIFIDCMAVDGKYRGCGVGTAMLRFITKKAADEGCDGVELQVNAKNIRAKALYERCGFAEKSINMELPCRMK